MVDNVEQFEMQDIEGQTKTYSSTVGTAGTSISFSGKFLQNVIIISNNKSDDTKDLQFRFSASESWISLGYNCMVGWTPKQTTEILLQGATNDTNYEVIANWEP